MNEVLLSLQTVSITYGQIHAVKTISLEIFKGEIISIIGANGAGKTSTLCGISGAKQLFAGKILLENTEIQNLPVHKRVLLGIAHVPEGRKIFPHLTVLENLELGAYTRSNKVELKNNFEKTYDLFPILKNRLSQLGGTLSGGEQQMLAIGRALMSNPRLLLLDEPSMGIAPLIAEKIFQTLKQLNTQGITILLVEQNAHMALQIAHRGYVMETGEIVLEGSGLDLLTNPKVKQAYLGE